MRKVLRIFALGVVASSAFAQDAVVNRRGDGTVVLPGPEGDVTITTRTVGGSSALRIPRRGVRLDEKQIDRFLRERAARDAEWT